MTEHNTAQIGIECAKFGVWFAQEGPYAEDVFDWRSFNDEELRKQFGRDAHDFDFSRKF